jgi:hypothetical protein
MEKEQTTQWPKGQTTIYKTKDLAKRTPLRTVQNIINQGKKHLL